MELNISNANFRLADREDAPIIKKILTESFKNDPHILWLIEKSVHKNKLEFIMDYVIEETFDEGSIYITRDNLGVALWKTGKKNRFKMNYVKRNLLFLFNMGVCCVIRNLKNKANTYRQFPKKQKYCYLYTIGVLPEAQGKGLASKLMNPVIEACRTQKLTLFLETANPENLKIYSKKGFVLSKTLIQNSINIFYMEQYFS